MEEQKHIPDGIINDSSTNDNQSRDHQLKESGKQQEAHTALIIKSIEEADDHSSVSKASISKSTIKYPPFFYYQNTTNIQSISNNFSLHSTPHTTTNYTTTLTLIIILHIIYFLQWNNRKSRKDISTTYNELINKKQYYKGILAIVSHPPIDGGERDAVMMTNGSEDGEYNNNPTTSSNPIERSIGIFQRICFFFSLRNRIYNNRLVQLLYHRLVYPFIYGSLSGLPLLTYCSHILWSCRALEELYDVHDGKILLGVVMSDDNGNQTSTTMSQFSGIGTDAIQIQSDGHILNGNGNTQHYHFDSSPTSYLRVLVALALTTTLLELSLLKSILKRVGQSLTINGRTTTEILSQYAMCSIAGLTTAILGVYDANFPYTPPPILPFVHVSALSGGFSLILSILILGMLTYRIHPITSIMSGLLSGSLWSLDVTSFLATRYWGNICILSLILAVLLSMKAQPTCQYMMEMIVPCISYVAWDRDGNIPDGSSGGQTSSRRNTDNEDEDGDLEMGANNERYPLLSSSQSSLNGDDSTVIRGRLPVMNAMESGDDSGVEESMPTSASRLGNLSRRAGGSSQVSMN